MTIYQLGLHIDAQCFNLGDRQKSRLKDGQAVRQADVPVCGINIVRDYP